MRVTYDTWQKAVMPRQSLGLIRRFLLFLFEDWVWKVEILRDLQPRAQLLILVIDRQLHRYDRRTNGFINTFYFQCLDISSIIWLCSPSCSSITAGTFEGIKSMSGRPLSRFQFLADLRQAFPNFVSPPFISVSCSTCYRENCSYESTL